MNRNFTIGKGCFLVFCCFLLNARFLWGIEATPSGFNVKVVNQLENIVNEKLLFLLSKPEANLELPIPNSKENENITYTSSSDKVNMSTSEVIISVTWPSFSEENRVELYDPSNTLIATICDLTNCFTGNNSNGNYTNATAYSGCLTDGTGYTVKLDDTAGDGWDGVANITVTSGGVTVISDAGPATSTETLSFEVSGGGSSCVPPCSATADAPVTVIGTCNGEIANNDGAAIVNNIVNADRIGISSVVANSYDGPDYGAASSISGNSHTFNNLQQGRAYIIRIYEVGGGACYTDISFTTAAPPSACPGIPLSLIWPGSECDGKSIMLQNSVGVLTCGVTVVTPAADRYTLALMNFDGTVPNSGRVETTSNVDAYHHPSWHIDSIGNVFGTAINNNTGDIFVTASTNYGGGFLGNDAVIRFGGIAGGTSNGNDDASAGGAVYKINATTGQASVFALLPQQLVNFTNVDCESTDATVRTNSGVGLGNIVYDTDRNQYFVSNIEDGRIYRLDEDGIILDSYDPFSNDDGVAGISDLEELVYGLAIEPGTNNLFFGSVDTVVWAIDNFAPVGSPSIYSISLTSSGGFPGTINNSTLPTGATYNNYEQTSETFHVSIPTGGGVSYGEGYIYLISDLAFNQNNQLLAGIRVGCKTTFFTSYNHWAETSIITRNSSSLLYTDNITELDISPLGDAGDDDVYGGVTTYIDTAGNDFMAVSSSDILMESGPHGIALFNDPPNTGGEVTPLAAVSYGVAGSDPKGVGGDIEVFTKCVEYDYGDLPDKANGTTGINDYETYDSTGGPSHQIIVGLFLGDTVDADIDGFPDSLAIGDDIRDGYDDEDGITIFPTLDIVPGGTIQLPLSVTNITGDTAYIEAWIDWNGDGDFDNASELVVDYKDNEDGVFPTTISIEVPMNAVTDSLLGFRVRLSNNPDMTPYGRVNSGEVEDYLLGISCPQIICVPSDFEINKK